MPVVDIFVLNYALLASCFGCMPTPSALYGFSKKKQRQAALLKRNLDVTSRPATVPLKQFDLDRDRYQGVDPDVLRVALQAQGLPSKRRCLQ